MIASTNLQTLQLDSLVAGETYLLVITNSPGDVALQFKHQSDPTTRVLPTHAAMAAAVVVTTFICPSPVMALVWAVPPPTTPGAEYFITLTPLTQREF